MIYTTLDRIRAQSPCASGWEKLLRHLGKSRADDAPLALLTVLESNGVDDALWCLRAEPQHASIWRLYAVRCARRVQHLMPDPRSVAAMDVAERHAIGKASDDELSAARASAWGVAWAAASAAAWATAMSTAWEAARNAARNAAWDIAAVDAARSAARSAAGGAPSREAWDAAWDAARAAQADDLRVVLHHYDALPGCEIHAWRGQEGGAT